MKTFHLPSLKTILLTVGRNLDRHANMRRFFNEHGYGNVEWIFGRPARNHHEGARETAIEVLRSIEAPTLWLEDDATPLQAYSATIEVPGDAQAVYLGGGRLGCSILTKQAIRKAGGSLAEVKTCYPKDFDTPRRRSLYTDTPYPQWIRIITMFTGHAILWLDTRMCRELADIISISHKPYDIAWATIQWRYRIYGLRSPYFYQDDGHHDHTITYCPLASES